MTRTSKILAGLVVTATVLFAHVARGDDTKKPRPVVCALQHFSEAKTAGGAQIGVCAEPGKRAVVLGAWSAPVDVGGQRYVVGHREVRQAAKLTVRLYGPDGHGNLALVASGEASSVAEAAQEARSSGLVARVYRGTELVAKVDELGRVAR